MDSEIRIKATHEKLLASIDSNKNFFSNHVHLKVYVESFAEIGLAILENLTNRRDILTIEESIAEAKNELHGRKSNINRKEFVKRQLYLLKILNDFAEMDISRAHDIYLHFDGTRNRAPENLLKIDREVFDILKGPGLNSNLIAVAPDIRDTKWKADSIESVLWKAWVEYSDQLNKTLPSLKGINSDSPAPSPKPKKGSVIDFNKATKNKCSTRFKD